MTEARITEEAVEAAKDKLMAALPPGHPARTEALTTIEALWQEIGDVDAVQHYVSQEAARAREVINAYAELTVIIDDWRRGIRDWGEVEERLTRARLAVGKLG